MSEQAMALAEPTPTATPPSPLREFWYYFSENAGAVAGLAVIVLWRHRENIARLRAGTEPRIGSKKDAPEASGAA